MSSTVIPSLRYKDAPAAIEWLCRAFGFEKNHVYPNPDGTIAHAQLTLGDGMIVLGSLTDKDHAVERADAQGIYVVVADCDAVYHRAKSERAEIVMDIRDMEYGGRGFSCHDPEGHLWSIGSYDPWKE